MSRNYVNPYGARLNACMYCGFCDRFGCEHYAKASANVTVLPSALANRNLKLRTNAHVLRVDTAPGTNRAVGVTYVDARAREIEQPGAPGETCGLLLNHVVLVLGWMSEKTKTQHT